MLRRERVGAVWQDLAFAVQDLLEETALHVARALRPFASFFAGEPTVPSEIVKAANAGTSPSSQ